MAIDYHSAFCRAVYEEVGEVCASHGFDYLHEEELEQPIKGLYARFYYPSITEFRGSAGMGDVVPKIRLW